jgi:hypothetical protein
MFGDDAQSGVKRDVRRVTFVEVERLLLCFPSCDSKRWGHKLQTGESFPSGVTVTQAEGQFDALADFVFNLGASRLASSTLLRDLNAGKYDDAGQQLLLWNHAGGVVVAGLKTRREVELSLWKNGADDIIRPWASM